MEKKSWLKYVCIAFLFLVFLATFFPWMKCAGGSYTITGFYMEVFSKGIGDVASEGEAILYLLPCFLIFPLAAGFLSGVKAVLLLCGIRSNLLGKIIYGAQLVYIATYFAFQGYMLYPSALLALFLTFTEFMIRRYLTDYEDFTREWKNRKIQEKMAKEEQKRRLSFPGRYDAELWRVVRRGALHQRKASVLICVGNSVLLAVLFVLFTLKDHLQHEYSTGDVIPTTGLSGIVNQAVIVTVILYIFFEAVALYHYADSRKQRERILWRLGARSTFKSQVRLHEYSLLIGLSFAVGHVLGTGIYLMVVSVLKENISATFPAQGSFTAYLWSIGVYFVVVCVISFLANDRWGKGEETGSSRLKTQLWKNPKIRKGVCFAGVLVLAVSLYSYSRSRNGENIYTVIFGVGGGALLLLFAGSFRKGRYASQKTAGILFLFHLLFLSVLAVDLAGILSAPQANELFPYDYVCMAYEEDEELFRQIEEDGIGDIESYPMARVTTVQGAPVSWIDVANNYYMKVIWPQGQHVAISESTYEKLKKNLGMEPQELHLQGEEIHIVYQQDLSTKAHPLDWYMNRRKPYVRIGQPLRYYQFVSRERLYPPRQVAGEERSILTGVFQGGMQEDLVVFSDSYFEKIDVTEGSSVLHLLQIKEGKETEAGKRIENFNKRHREDSSWSKAIRPSYEKQEKIQNTQMERFLKKTALVFESVLLIMCVFLVEGMKVHLEKTERMRRYYLLFSMGAYRRDIRKILKKELGTFLIKPLIYACVWTAPVAVLTCVLRKMTVSEVLAFAGWYLVLGGIYLMIQAVAYGIIYKSVERSLGYED